MSVVLGFTIAEELDGLSCTFTETTGNTSGAYDGDPDYTDILNTRFEWTLPNGSIVNLSPGYLPTQNASPNGTQSFYPVDFGMSGFASGVYSLVFKVYRTNISPLGPVVAGQEYIVTGAGAITYNGATYTQNQIFEGAAGQSVYSIVTGSPYIAALHGSETCNVLFYRTAQKCIQQMLLMRCNDCDCRDSLSSAAMEIMADFESAIVAFQHQSYDCANKTLMRLDKYCGKICGNCKGC